MKSENLIKPAITVAALVSVVGLAYAQTGTGSASQPNTATPPAANSNTAPPINPSANDLNRAPTPSNNRSNQDRMSGQSPDTPARGTNERVARADRG